MNRFTQRFGVRLLETRSVLELMCPVLRVFLHYVVQVMKWLDALAQ